MSADAAFAALAGRTTGALRQAEEMVRHTSYRIGGPADLFAECDTMSDLTTVLAALAEHAVEWTVIGRGTNLLVSDEGYRGAVVVLGREFGRRARAGSLLEAGAGCSLGGIVQWASAEGVAGFEFAAGVPGTLGGALVMNAGTRDEWIGSVVESVTVLVPGQGLRRLHGNEVAWGYRSTDLASHGVVVEAELRAVPGDRDAIRARMEESLARRKASQPLGKPNAGSVFRNPEGDSAGRLIESAGLKGVRIGGARISQVHANFIVNEGGASARDVLELMHLARDRVREDSGIELRPEVRFLGSFSRA